MIAAKTGEEGGELALKEWIDLIRMDIQLQDINQQKSTHLFSF